MPLTIHPRSDLAHVVELAGRLERKSVYDAVYVALADSLQATLVALDGPLYRNARARGLPVELLRTEVSELAIVRLLPRRRPSSSTTLVARASAATLSRASIP